MEVWNLYNSKGEKLDKTMIRGDKVPENMYHLVVHIIIKNSKGDYLIQKRSDNKDLFPGIWAFTGGAAMVGETSETAALRELSEETGIHLNIGDLKFEKRLMRYDDIADIWYGVVDADVSTLKFQIEEVTALSYKTKDEIKKMIENKEFHHYEASYLYSVFII